MEGDPDSVSHFRFLGIPYAQAPVGQLRFLATRPLPARPWGDQVRNATEFGTKCPQVGGRAKHIEDIISGSIGEEDCLFLNIFTPYLPVQRGFPKRNSSRLLLPVLFYVHGGGFSKGSGEVDPSPLLQKGVMVVSANFRLSALGYLNLHNPLVPGTHVIFGTFCAV